MVMAPRQVLWSPNTRLPLISLPESIGLFNRGSIWAMITGLVFAKMMGNGFNQFMDCSIIVLLFNDYSSKLVKEKLFRGSFKFEKDRGGVEGYLVPSGINTGKTYEREVEIEEDS